jgi:hypothetical protein
MGEPGVDMFLISPCDGKWKYIGHTDSSIDHITDHDWDHVEPKLFGQYLVPQLKYPGDYLTRLYGSTWDSLAVVKPLHTVVHPPIWKGLNIMGVVHGCMCR